MTITTEIKRKIAQLAVSHNLNLVILFGSQATGRTHEKSDIDIAVLSRVNINKQRIALEFDEIFRRDDIEVTDLSKASPTLMREIVSDGQMLYEAHPDLFFRWKLYAIKIWMETSWLRSLANRKAREWVKTL